MYQRNTSSCFSQPHFVCNGSCGPIGKMIWYFDCKVLPTTCKKFLATSSNRLFWLYIYISIYLSIYISAFHLVQVTDHKSQESKLDFKWLCNWPQHCSNRFWQLPLDWISHFRPLTSKGNRKWETIRTPMLLCTPHVSTHVFQMQGLNQFWPRSKWVECVLFWVLYRCIYACFLSI